MTTRQTQHVHLGFAVGTGEPVEVPLAHTFVTGQTQLSGKTSTLRALVERSGRRAIAFVTKRGETFDGRRVAPYLPREGDKPIPWRLVETIIASALGQRSMKYERLWIVNAAKGARSLADVRRNVTRLMGKAKGASGDMYMLLGEYLDLVLPEMQELDASDTLDLKPGLNVMDLAGVSGQLQALVIRAALERINHHETGVLTVFPEAWEFAPRGRVAPASEPAIAMARKGAVLGNFLLCDSQDIAGVDTTIRQATSVWILGVQRELNELRRTIQSIPAGIARPKPEDVATLSVGQFYACWGRQAVKTYVQPVWLDADDARAVAMGHKEKPMPPAFSDNSPRPLPKRRKVNHNVDRSGWSEYAWTLINEANPQIEDDTMSKEDVDRLEKTIERTMGENAKAIRELAGQMAAVKSPPGAKAAAAYAFGNGERHASASPAPESIDEDAMYQRFKARLASEAPALLKVATTTSELEVTCTRKVLETDETSALGMIAILLKDGWFGESPKKAGEVWKEMKRRWNYGGISARAYEQLDKLTAMGFVTKEGEGYKAVAGMKITKKER